MREVYGNITLMGLWKTRNGHYATLPLDERGISALKNLVEQGKGGKVLIRFRTEDAIAKSANPKNAPQAYLEFIPQEVLDSKQKAAAAATSVTPGDSTGL